MAFLTGGVRSTTWCLSFLEAEGVGFEGHHERVKQLAGVDAAAWGMAHVECDSICSQALNQRNWQQGVGVHHATVHRVSGVGVGSLGHQGQ